MGGSVNHFSNVTNLSGLEKYKLEKNINFN